MRLGSWEESSRVEVDRRHAARIGSPGAIPGAILRSAWVVIAVSGGCGCYCESW
jgi:hypothetical protein